MASRDSHELIEDLCFALRNVAVGNYGLPQDQRIVRHIGEVKALYAEILKRDVNTDVRIRQLSGETGWQMEVLLADCLAADSEGWRSAFRTDVDHDSEVMPISIPN